MLFINKSEKFCTNHFLKGPASGSFVSSEVEDGRCKDALKCRDGSSGCILVRSTCRRGHYVHNFDKAFATQLCKNILRELSLTKKIKPKCAVCLEVAVASGKRHFNCIQRNVQLFEFFRSVTVLSSLLTYYIRLRDFVLV